ncbi:hypothetical protein ACVBEH_14585 [Roseateles sp. GG27B]
MTDLELAMHPELPVRSCKIIHSHHLADWTTATDWLKPGHDRRHTLLHDGGAVMQHL